MFRKTNELYYTKRLFQRFSRIVQLYELIFNLPAITFPRENTTLLVQLCGEPRLTPSPSTLLGTQFRLRAIIQP